MIVVIVTPATGKIKTGPDLNMSDFLLEVVSLDTSELHPAASAIFEHFPGIPVCSSCACAC